MEFTMRKDIDEYRIEEQGRCVFRASYEKEDGLLSVYLKNMFGDDIMGFYQVFQISSMHEFYCIRG